MPEGPQIVFLKEQTEQFVGKTVINAAGHAQNIPLARLAGQTLVEIKTFGKELLFCFRDFTIRVHLMFFGKYAINAELNRELQLGLTFETGEINFYACDCRFIPEPQNQLYDWTTDVLHLSFDRENALDKLYQQPNRLICDALLDQGIFAGVGNGIKNEALFHSHIHPESLTGEIPEAALRNLIRACVQVSKDYLRWIQEGTAQENWQVYRRKICPRDNIPFQKEKIGKSGRSCYFCDKCQQLYLPDAV